MITTARGSRHLRCLLLIALTALIPISGFAQSKAQSKAKSTSGTSEKKAKQAKKQTAKNKATLKDLFPDKSPFGPRASSTAFSNDGRYVGFRYRPYNERRHGSDVWVYDFQKKELKRITNVLMMAEYQKSARAVKQERLKAAKKKKTSKEKTDKNTAKKNETKKKQKTDNAATKKKRGKKKRNRKNRKESTGKKSPLTSEFADDENLEELVLKVDDKDADNASGKRYSGIASFEWHPTKNQMLLVSEGDVYELTNIESPKIKRLTKTSARESSVEYLPDGSGMIYQSEDVYRVRFGDHFIEQISPSLPSGQRLSRYTLSPDGSKMVLMAQTGSRLASDRNVDIIRYRGRFAKSSSISRTVSDDELKPQDIFIYLLDLNDLRTESPKLVEVMKTKIDDPRDVVSTPSWSLDNKRVTFCFFDQKESEVQIMVAEFPKKDDKKKSPADSKSEKNPAKVVYRFKHDGGPNTPRMVSPKFAYDSRHIAFVSEQTGFRHVHLLDTLYQSVRVLTTGNFEVYPIEMSDNREMYFVNATKDSPARQMVYALNLKTGDLDRISQNVGTYSSVAVNDNGSRLAGNFVTYGKLTELVVQDKNKSKTLTDSHPKKIRRLTQAKPEFFKYQNRHGHEISGMMFKPEGWKKAKKVPLLIYVYGGPLGTRKSVTDGSYSSSSYFFQNYMAQKHGYLTVTIDPRGQSGYGGLFEKSNYEQVGKPQVEDLVDGVKFLTKEFNIDNKKVGIFGWSFGGFQTQMCLYTAPETFQVGIAGAGPTEWENYNAWYTTGTVGPSKKGTPDQKKYSLRPLAKNLKGKMLLIHGMEDTNVLFQDTVAIYRELLKAGKETNVELFLDPTGGHGLGGDVKRLNRYRKYEEFLLRTLGSAKPKRTEKSNKKNKK